MTFKKQDRYNNPFSAVVTGIRDLFRKQDPAGELKPTDRLEGKTVLVDGASSGLGFAIATECACRGARVIMACRSGIPEKGEEVKRISGSREVQMVYVDFSDISSIERLVSELARPTEIEDALAGSDGQTGNKTQIDILICNAGTVPKKSRRTPQGVEEMFMVNYLSKFIFVKLLIESGRFRRSEAHPCGNGKAIQGIPRIIFVDSETHRNPKQFEWEKFGLYEPYTIGKSLELYGYYKLLLATYAVELSRRLNRDHSLVPDLVSGDPPFSGVRFSVFALCPGPVNTNIGREAPKIFRPLMKLVFSLFFRSPAKAAIPVLYLAASKDVEGKPFDYLFLMSRKEIDEKASDPDHGKKLWDLSENLYRKLQAVK